MTLTLHLDFIPTTIILRTKIVTKANRRKEKILKVRENKSDQAAFAFSI